MVRKLLLLFGSMMAGAIMLTISTQAQTGVDSTRDCDDYAVIRCGTMSIEEVRNKYDQASVIFQSFGISKADVASETFKDGIVHRDGRVTISGKTVATGAETAIRNISGGTQIPGTNATRVSTSRMASDQTALVKVDQNGKFLFAIMKPCGNPVTATPVPPVQPTEQTLVCQSLSMKRNPQDKLSFTFNGAATTRGGATIQNYTFDFGDGSSTTVNNPRGVSHTYKIEGTYKVRMTVNGTVDNKSVQRTSQSCTVSLTSKPDECIPGIPVGDARCEKCPIAGYENLPKDSPDCKELPPELPETGITDSILQLFGVGSLVSSLSYYLASRRFIG